MTTMKHVTVWALALGLPMAPLTAQLGGGNPMEEIKEIAEAVDKQLQEIDRLLLESGKKGQSRKTPKEMLEQASEGSKAAEDGIDKLIEKLSEMSQQSSSSSSSSQQQQQQQQQEGQQQGQQQQQGQEQNRRENQTPDFVQQPEEGEQQGQEQQQQGQREQEGQPQPQNRPGQPQGAEEASAAGENQTGNSPPKGSTSEGKAGSGAADWGGLQPYLNFLKNRGASPKVPEKYRRYYEAYLKNKAKGGKK